MIKQWGSATSGQTVNLLPYKDTNYAVTLANGVRLRVLLWRMLQGIIWLLVKQYWNKELDN